ncbi:MAG: [Fe-Fe] hydrogenase large subunit C-terminal domain-containing protein [Oscillospiraceae bacterium]|nr:[Fe-Fe] hydrogenase large subunit C-terminal domain-containing protein [Oscillospiraceae bacterium]
MTEYLTFKKSNCKNCYKCIRNCPVKSIRFSGNLASVIPDDCILCGQCYVVCPQNAKQIVDETEKVGVLLKGGAPVYASVAPSFSAYFDGAPFAALETALKSLGFAAAEETALGATMVKREYEKLAAAGAQDVIITSCCPTVNMLVEKYYPQLTGYLAPVMTPMQAHCADIKRRVPDAKTVFIGPCLSKKAEADRDGVDAALTFDELRSLLDAQSVALAEDPAAPSASDGRARLFPTDGGILKSMLKFEPAYTYLSIDGMESCKSALEDIAAGGLRRCFIEMSACEGSCIGGPILQKHKRAPLRGYQAVAASAGEADFAIEQPDSSLLAAQYTCELREHLMPGESEIAEILRQMGKTKPEDELNCGTCGYNTCREKAVAVYQGKAELSMCLPYLMDKSERFTNDILENTPNGILVVNERMEIQQLNRAALRTLNINSRADVLGEQLVRIMDPTDFIAVLNGAPIVDKRGYYAEFDRCLELTIVHDRVSKHLIAIFRDVSDEENARKSKEAFSRQTVETADRVVDKQMRIVQEIASLLGETAAETKIALTKLKESITDDNHQ